MKKTKSKPQQFRFSPEAAAQLRQIAEALDWSSTLVLERLITLYGSQLVGDTVAELETFLVGGKNKKLSSEILHNSQGKPVTRG